MQTIGDLARMTGCKVQTIRYYETIGVMPEPERTAGNQRRYSARSRRRLSFIRHARDLGFSIGQIRSLLALQDDPEVSCKAADAIAAEHLGAVEARLHQLEALKTELIRMLDHDTHGRIADCRVIEVLAEAGPGSP